MIHHGDCDVLNTVTKQLMIYGDIVIDCAIDVTTEEWTVNIRQRSGSPGVVGIGTFWFGVGSGKSKSLADALADAHNQAINNLTRQENLNSHFKREGTC